MSVVAALAGDRVAMARALDARCEIPPTSSSGAGSDDASDGEIAPNCMVDLQTA